ncbi:hypothetical protein LTR56_002421 [Elasticomyces elasticus]|nr:hypothetical protein LTR56_002421 [Elasticomyces elasticus]KAK3665985.1 hypothetical protein LTR22_003304 [Elasticomyces elasticus]KAK4929457.1 hypothetical protein LTR49_004061 [Elasticomyces elasticus]KAK5744263.1 hypothetical protein LTS12_023580 [Elasticomyces elasticus]
MLSQLQSTYQRIDASLQRLTDSIAAYNPSPTAASDLLAADDALTTDLSTLLTHQHNTHTLSALHSQARDNDEKIKTQFRAVAASRKEVMGIPSFSAPTAGAIREVGVQELLGYARFIGATTVPPTSRGGDLPGVKGKAEMNGGTPPAAGRDNGAGDGDTDAIKRTNAATNDMNPAHAAWLSPDLPFAPWPEQYVITGGALGRIQIMLEQGKDPGAVLSPAEQKEADEVKRVQVERERVEEEERVRRGRGMFDTVGRKREREEMENDVFDPDA